MEGPPLGPGGEDITWPDQVAPRGRKASSTRKIKHQTPNTLKLKYWRGGDVWRVGYTFFMSELGGGGVAVGVWGGWL